MQEKAGTEQAVSAESPRRNDFTQGSMIGNICRMAVPMTIAQLINLLYNVVDRIYLGQMESGNALGLTGVGICLPILSVITAFASLFGMGGAPLCSIERGKGNDAEAEFIMGNSFVLLVGTGLVLTVLGVMFRRPLLYAFGASNATYPYADVYLTIYLLGSIFVMLSQGLNSFINAQGFGGVGMMTVLIGAVLNLILDPIFIFVLDGGVAGAAWATILAQFVSAVWTLWFLLGKRAILRLKKSCFRLKASRVRSICALGMSGFVMAFTNSAVQTVCNATLQQWGGDLYVGIMTVLTTIHEVLFMPIRGLNNGVQPVAGYNYGAGEYRRVKKGILFDSAGCFLYAIAAWGILMLFPEFFVRLFNQDPELVRTAVPALRIYFFAFFMMAFQMAGQTTYLALGKSRYAIFFSLLRKAFIVVPLTLLLPRIGGLGVNGVFLAEPVSNVVGGIACYGTMLVTVWRRDLSEKPKKEEDKVYEAG